MRRAPGFSEEPSEEKGMPARGPLEALESREAREAARRIACLGLSFHVLSYYVEDTGVDAGVEPLCSGEPRIVIHAASCVDDTLEALKRSLPRILGAPIMGYTLECVEGFGGEYPGFSQVTSMIVRLFSNTFYKPLSEASVTGREYFVVIGWNGEIAYGRGGEYEIRLPLIPAVAFAHTHPGLSCYPSAQDLSSAADFLAAGGLAEFLVSRSCTSSLRLLAPLSEEDYWTLRRVSGCVKGSRESEDYLECLAALNGLRTVAFEVL